MCEGVVFFIVVLNAALVRDIQLGRVIMLSNEQPLLLIELYFTAFELIILLLWDLYRWQETILAYFDIAEQIACSSWLHRFHLL